LPVSEIIPTRPSGAADDCGGEALPAALLQGVRVLDLTNVLSGPFCTYQMALLGAEVIKIENPNMGDLARQLGADADLNHKLMGASFIAQNAGKKSLTLNLKAAQGRDIFKRLVATADVVVENFRPGVMDRLGIGYETLRTIKPSLIYCAISGFGQTGPLKDNPAYDQIIQGMSGVMSITGDAQSAPLRVGYPVCDTLGGLTGAFAIVSALYASRITGQGRAIDVSMLDSTLVALGWVVSNYLTAGVIPVPLGNENMTAAPSGTFRTRDGLLNIAANKQEHFEALATLIGRPDLLTDERFAERESRKRNRAALNSEINEALSTRDSAEWETALNAIGVPSGQVLTVPEVLAHPQVQQRRLVQSIDVPGKNGNPVQVVRAGYRLSDCDPTAQSAPPLLGEHTDETLANLGIDQETITELRAGGII
jgi:crotonobetainyl-CoA:carnitine CoA-transferase CaiB-like acyl-CoA transferase